MSTLVEKSATAKQELTAYMKLEDTDSRVAVDPTGTTILSLKQTAREMSSSVAKAYPAQQMSHVTDLRTAIEQRVTDDGPT